MKKIILFIFVFLIAHSAFAQSKFNLRYGSSYFDRPRHVIETKDGNYIVVGQTNGFGSTGNAFMMKVDTGGTILWMKDYEGINQDIAYDVIELSDSSLVFCGVTQSFGSGSYDAFMTKTDKNGNVIWSNAYGSILWEEFFRLFDDGNGGIFAEGYGQTSSLTEGTTIVRIDSYGNILWSQWIEAWVHTGYWFPASMTKLRSGGLVFIGVGNSGLGCWKFSLNGSLVWSKTFSGVSIKGLSVFEDVSNDLWISTTVMNSSTVAQSQDFAVLKLDSTGTLKWYKSYGQTYGDYDLHLTATSDTGAIIIGSTNSAGNGDYDQCIIKLNNDGLIQWANTYGTVWKEMQANGQQTRDGGFITTGQTWATGTLVDSSKIHLLKTDGFGYSSCTVTPWNPIAANQTTSDTTAIAPLNIPLHREEFSWPVQNRNFYRINICDVTSTNDIESGNKLIVYPNPFTKTFTIDINENIMTAQLRIYDNIGREIYSEKINDEKKTIDCDLSQGIYLIQITNGEKTWTQKLVKE